MRELANDVYELGALVAGLVDNANHEWQTALTSSKEGCLAWVLRMRERFLSNVEKQRAQCKGRMPNLRATAPSLREPKPEEAFMLSTWWLLSRRM